MRFPGPGVTYQCVGMCMRVQVSWRPEDGTRSFGAGVTGSSVRNPMWVIGNELGCYTRATSNPNH